MADLYLNVDTTRGVEAIRRLDAAMTAATARAEALLRSMQKITATGVNQAVSAAIETAEKRLSKKEIRIPASLHVNIDRDLSAIQAVINQRGPLVIPAVVKMINRPGEATVPQARAAAATASAAASRGVAANMAWPQRAAANINRTAAGVRFGAADQERFVRHLQSLLPWIQVSPARLDTRQMQEGQMAAWLLRWPGLKHPVRTFVGTPGAIERVGGAGTLAYFKKSGFQGTLGFTPGAARIRSLVGHEAAGHMIMRNLLSQEQIDLLAKYAESLVKRNILIPGKHAGGVTKNELVADLIGGYLGRISQDPGKYLPRLAATTNPAGRLLHDIYTGKILGAAAQAPAAAAAAAQVRGAVNMVPAYGYGGLIPGRINKALADSSLRGIEEAFYNLFSQSKGGGYAALKANIAKEIATPGSPIRSFIVEARRRYGQGGTIELGRWERSAGDRPGRLHQSDLANLLFRLISSEGETTDFSKIVPEKSQKTAIGALRKRLMLEEQARASTKAYYRKLIVAGMDPEKANAIAEEKLKKRLGAIERLVKTPSQERYAELLKSGLSETEALQVLQQGRRKSPAAAAASAAPAAAPRAVIPFKAIYNSIAMAEDKQAMADRMVMKFGYGAMTRFQQLYGGRLSGYTLRTPEQISKITETITSTGAKVAETEIKKAAAAQPSPAVATEAKRTIEAAEAALLGVMPERMAKQYKLYNMQSQLRKLESIKRESPREYARHYDKLMRDIEAFKGSYGGGGAGPGGGLPGGAEAPMRKAPSALTSGLVAKWSIYMSGLAATLFVFQEVSQIISKALTSGAKYEETMRGIARATKMSADAHAELRDVFRAQVRSGEDYTTLGEIFTIMTRDVGISSGKALGLQQTAAGLSRVLGIRPKEAAAIAANDIFGYGAFYAPEIEAERRGTFGAGRRAIGTLQNISGEWFTGKEPELIKTLEAIEQWLDRNKDNIKAVLDALLGGLVGIGTVLGGVFSGILNFMRDIEESRIYKNFIGNQDLANVMARMHGGGGYDFDAGTIVRKKLPEPPAASSAAGAALETSGRGYAPLMPEDLQNMANFLAKNMNIPGPALEIMRKGRAVEMTRWNERLAASPPEAQKIFAGMAALVERFYDAQEWLMANEPLIQALDNVQDILKEATPASMRSRLLSLETQRLKVGVGMKYGTMLPPAVIERMAEIYGRGLWLQQERPYATGASELYKETGYVSQRWMKFLEEEAKHKAITYFGGLEGPEAQKFLRMEALGRTTMAESPIERAMTRTWEETGYMPSRLVAMLKARKEAYMKERLLSASEEAIPHIEKTHALEMMRIDIESYEKRLEYLRRYYNETGRMTREHYRLEQKYIEDTTELEIAAKRLSEKEARKAAQIRLRALEEMRERPLYEAHEIVQSKTGILSEEQFRLAVNRIERTAGHLKDLLGEQNPLVGRAVKRMQEELMISKITGTEAVTAGGVGQAVFLRVKHSQELLAKEMTDIWSSAAFEMGDAFQKGFFDVMEARFKRLADVAATAADIIKRATYETIYGFVKSGINSLAMPYLESLLFSGTPTGMGTNTVFPGGKTMGDFMGMVKMASGGVITEPIVGIGRESGRKYLLGEAGPEIVAPLGAAAGAAIKINVNNYSGAPVEVRENRSPGGERELEVVIGQILTKDGPAARALQAAYGLNRVGVRR